MKIGIRREDKNSWEKRVPLIPKDLKELKDKFGIESIIQPSNIRIFNNRDYEQEGLIIDENLDSADTIFAVKEIPIDFFRRGKTYVYFSHVIKGQQHNLPMLKRMMELGCNLIDYEKILDENNKRMIFFGKHAGYAGLVETLHIFGEKLKLEGFYTPFLQIKRPYQYSSIEEVRSTLINVGEEIKSTGLPLKITPIVIGFIGYGNVSAGAQEIFDILPHKTIPAEMLTIIHDSLTLDNTNLYKVVFKEENIVERKDKAVFNLQEYYSKPELFQSTFERYIPYSSMLINCIFWTDKYPRNITKNYLRNSYIKQSRNKLKVIGDISCDVNGSIEITHKATELENPTYTYNFLDDTYKDGIHNKGGITVMAVDNLPCEFPLESSVSFSSVLKSFVYDIVKTDFTKETNKLNLPAPLRKALILHNGKLTDDYQYLKKVL